MYVPSKPENALNKIVQGITLHAIQCEKKVLECKNIPGQISRHAE
jgi:hypothetical protein